jgi:hypothetical protein
MQAQCHIAKKTAASMKSFYVVVKARVGATEEKSFSSAPCKHGSQCYPSGCE